MEFLVQYNANVIDDSLSSLHTNNNPSSYDLDTEQIFQHEHCSLFRSDLYLDQSDSAQHSSSSSHPLNLAFLCVETATPAKQHSVSSSSCPKNNPFLEPHNDDFRLGFFAPSLKPKQQLSPRLCAEASTPAEPHSVPSSSCPKNNPFLEPHDDSFRLGFFAPSLKPKQKPSPPLCVEASTPDEPHSVLSSSCPKNNPFLEPHDDSFRLGFFAPP